MWNYDPWGHITEITDGNDQKTGFELDVWGRATKVLLADGSEESYGYDGAGNMLSSTDGNGNT